MAQKLESDGPIIFCDDELNWIHTRITRFKPASPSAYSDCLRVTYDPSSFHEIMTMSITL